MIGLMAASTPVSALAKGEGRALETADDMWRVALFTLAGVGGLLLVTAIGYLYRHERGLAWGFQKPDAPEHDEEHD
jgi:hypothetical protein